MFTLSHFLQRVEKKADSSKERDDLVGLHPIDWPFDSNQVWETDIGGKRVQVQDWVSSPSLSLVYFSLSHETSHS